MNAEPPPIVEAAPVPAGAAAAVEQDRPVAPPAPAPCRGMSCEGVAPNVISLELLGSGLLYSLNYQRIFAPWRFGIRAGASFFTSKVSRENGSGSLVLATFPVMASVFLGPERHKVELGLGATVMYFSASSDSTGTKFEGSGVGLGLAGAALVGYRYVPRDGGVTFGAGFTPLLRAEKGFLPWGGANLGYMF